jgi:transposase-like protein
MRSISFKRHRFPPDVIRHAVWLYFRFTLGLRDVEELLAQRGVEVSYETMAETRPARPRQSMRKSLPMSRHGKDPTGYRREKSAT